MSNTPSILRAAHELLIDMVGRKVAGDAREEIDIAFRNRLAEGNALPADALPAAGEVRYVQTFLHTEEAMDAHLGIDSGGPTKAWLNGHELFSLDRYRPIRPSYAGSKDAYADARLEAGWNELLVKLVRAADDPGFDCHLLLSTADRLHHGLPQIGRTQFPWD